MLLNWWNVPSGIQFCITQDIFCVELYSTASCQPAQPNCMHALIYQYPCGQTQPITLYAASRMHGQCIISMREAV